MKNLTRHMLTVKSPRSSGFRKVRGWLRGFTWIREESSSQPGRSSSTHSSSWCVSGRVGEPSLKSPSVVEEGEKRVYIARLPSLPFPRLTMRFMPALKRFSQKKRVRVNVDGATRRREGQGWRARNDLGNDLQFLLPAVSAFFSSYAKRWNDRAMR